MNTPESEFDVGAWLDAQGLGVYREVFAANHIDRAILATLSVEDLRDLGVASFGHRRRLRDAIGKLTGNNAAVTPAVDVTATPAEAAAPHAERRQLTVMFCDLVGSTTFAANMDPEDWREHVTAYRSCLSGVVQRYKGFIAQLLGDGLLVYFGYPHAQETDAERAVRAGLAMVREVAALPPVAAQTRLQVRIGIASGLVVVGDPAEAGLTRDIGVIGETPNLAARLQSLAEPGSVVISSGTHRLLGDTFSYTDLGEQMLKGFAMPVHILRVDGERAVSSRFAALHAIRDELPLMDREGEVTRLLDRLAIASSGQGQVVVVTGEAGIGKSRLVDELHGRLDPANRRRLILQCLPDLAQTPLHPFISQLEYVSGMRAGDTLEARRRKLQEWLVKLDGYTEEWLPITARLLRLEETGDDPLKRFSPADVRVRTMRALNAIVEALTSRYAFVVIEDIQWADPSTLELLERIVHGLPSEPSLLIVTQRGKELHPWCGASHVTLMHLERLQPRESRRLAQSAAGTQPISEAQLSAIVERSDGVPVYVIELTRALTTAGVAAADGKGSERNAADALAVPHALSEVLLARLDDLNHGREIAQVAAVIGREFLLDLLTAIAERAPDEVRVAVEQLIAAGILTRRHNVFGRAASFSQTLVRDAAYQLLLKRERMAMHRRVADTIAAEFPEMAQAMPQRLAHHYQHAGDAAAALDWWERAGDDAAKRSANQEALAYYDSALDCCARLDAGRARDEREMELRLHRVGPMIAVRGYGSGEVLREVDLAFDLCAQLQAKHRIVPALAAKWLAHLGGADMQATYALAVKISEAALDGSEVDRLLACRFLGSSLMFRGEFDGALAQLNRFQSSYDAEQHDAELAKVGATSHPATVKLCLAEIHAIKGENDRAGAWQRAALEAAEATGHIQTQCQTLAFAGGFLAALMHDAQALRAHGGKLKRLATRYDMPLWRPLADLLAGLADIRIGAAESGFALAREAIRKLIGSNTYLLSTWCIVYAEACEEAGFTGEGLEVLTAVEHRVAAGERWMAAEFLRLHARLSRRAGEPFEKVLAATREAVAVASSQGATLFLERSRADLAALAA